jgi:23S rRNA (pseudouridine1915-N3)-methyltransferase
VRLLVVAVGNRMMDWVDAGFAEYAKRIAGEWRLELVPIKAEPRSGGKPAAAMMTAEAGRIRAALPARCRRVALDEHGVELTTRALADRLAAWTGDGDDVAFIIGGPDGLDAGLKAEASETVRLSGLTLPHGLVRVMLAEALYRAASVLKGHPYHRQ